MTTKTHQPTLTGDADLALDDFEQSLEAGSSKKGRPKGAKNRAVDEVEAPATACKKCGSTRRAPYSNLRTLQVAGIDTKTGQSYTAIEWRRTACLDCGQHRDDRTLVNQVASRDGRKGSRP